MSARQGSRGDRVDPCHRLQSRLSLLPRHRRDSGRYIGSVLHKALISVDGQGAEAAAARRKTRSHWTKSRTWFMFLAVEATTMKKTVNIYEAKTHFSQLLDRVMAGEEIVIGKAGKPVARLVPIVGAVTARFAGSAAGVITIAPNFDAPLPDEVLGGLEA